MVEWLNMIMTYAIQAEISIRDGDSPIDVLDNLQTFIEDEISVRGGKLNGRVRELQKTLKKQVAKIRKQRKEKGAK